MNATASWSPWAEIHVVACDEPGEAAKSIAPAHAAAEPRPAREKTRQKQRRGSRLEQNGHRMKQDGMGDTATEGRQEPPKEPRDGSEEVSVVEQVRGDPGSEAEA
jgi:hypothetical protein